MGVRILIEAGSLLQIANLCRILDDAKRVVIGENGELRIEYPTAIVTLTPEQVEDKRTRLLEAEAFKGDHEGFEKWAESLRNKGVQG